MLPDERVQIVIVDRSVTHPAVSARHMPNRAPHLTAHPTETAHPTQPAHTTRGAPPSVRARTARRGGAGRWSVGVLGGCVGWVSGGSACGVCRLSSRVAGLQVPPSRDVIFMDVHPSGIVITPVD
eukprot:3711066-Prymnesium_polylepis.1